MTELERRALLGDAEAQRECTERGIVLPCPFCGSTHTQVRHMGWENPPQAFQAGYRGECTVCHAVTGAHDTEQEALADWNTRPAPPIGRCASCACWDENTCECAAAAGIEVAYHRYTEPDFFCGDYEPKGGEENG